MAIINECGLYKIIMRSNKPNAEKFQEVVCGEILPTLRKKGEYKIQSIIDKNKELEEEKLKIEEEEKIKKDENKKYTCICGSILNIKSKKKHEQSLKHLKYK